jgi:hypothetical protein
VAIALVPDVSCSQHLDASEHLHYLLGSLREMPANTRKSIKTINF